MAEKLRDVPPERIQTPDPHVVGPTLEALRFTAHQEQLRELYGNLLATSLDADTALNAHPAFVEIINSMSPDEAKIMRLFAVTQAYPTMEVRLWWKDQPGYATIYRFASLIGEEAGCAFEHLTPSYLDNLIRLGLLSGPEVGAMIAAEESYEPLNARLKDALKTAAERGDRIELMPGFIQRTDLGLQFCRACMIDRTPPPTP